MAGLWEHSGCGKGSEVLEDIGYPSSAGVRIR